MHKSQLLRIGIVAHDRMKAPLLEWITKNVKALAPHRFVATGTTGKMLNEHLPQLDISPLKSGPFGGDSAAVVPGIPMSRIAESDRHRRMGRKVAPG